MKSTNLIAWLSDPRLDQFFGRTYVIRADVLAHHITGQGTLAAIARKHRVSKAALTQHARRAREIFGGPGKAPVDLKPRSNGH